MFSFPSNALLWSLSSETTWVGSCVFGYSRVENTICGCCRVTSQKRLSYRLQALSSLFFAVMPSILRIRLDGWFSRCRGQSSGKSASRQRSYEHYSRDVQEPIDVHAKSHAMFERERFATGALFSTVQLGPAHGGLSNPIVRMGRSPAHVQACWVDQKFCDISCTFGIDKLTDLYTCIIMQGAKI